MALHTVISQCIADTYIDDSTPNANYGNSNILRLNSTNVFWNIIFMKFAQANIPERKRIISVILYLYLTEPLNALNDRLFSITIPASDCSPERWENWEYEITANKFKNATTRFGGTILAEISNKWLASGNYQAFELRTYRMPPYVISLDGATIAFHSRENTNPPYIEIVYEDVPPDKPTLISPIGEYKDSNSIIRFEWQYNSSVGGTQKAFDLQWSTDQVNWNTISDETSDTFYDMPAKTLPSGNIYWRVRTYNEYDEASEYSDIATFYSIAAPNYAVIQSISNAARPVIQWQADNQQVFQIQILQNDDVVYDSGEQPGVNTRSHKVNAFLEDGTYVARIRIKNEYDLWSDWSEYQFVISTTKPDKPILAVQRSPYGLELTIGNVQSEAYIYRDGVPIAKVTGQKYFDHTVANGKEYRYFVRALSGNGFADSDVVIGIPAFRIGLLNVGEEVIELKYNLNSVPDKDLSCVPVGAMNHYDGRELPVAEMSDNTNITLSLTYFFKGFAKVEKIMEAARKKGVVLYRDKKGLKLYGVITNITIQDVINGYIVSFTIAATDHNEAVEI
ncbi:hypothetical protein CSTERTH_01100 [Thermoclostridium stercorarium subsp. thermolacticum DSM 2910]|uniref:Fibronectin type-III domain-containing protein n=1 Tax=Thermoclostridium stercorarium subsp. thermolacticum DSM 2910 TaxID=1121336 RepID=A0A1B1YAD7_THEST|nr:hypothetical protein [Thermoclostridium stercorarium]ANW97725.1 hypothetical protein CSTERTH_01100 [Thermoclostridium stercorarium subsp. thermolacticum DSM 2910]